MTAYPRIEIAARAIWAVRSSHPKIPGMTWNELLEALDANPGSWSEEYERVFRQATTVIAALDAARSEEMGGNTLPLEMLPEGWRFSSLTCADTVSYGQFWEACIEKPDGKFLVEGDMERYGHGSTPRDAMLGAIEAAKEKPTSLPQGSLAPR